MIYLVMGVSGSGKSTIGELLASQLACRFYDADDFHPQENIDKMTQGISLTDKDRQPWLGAINSFMQQLEHDAVMACSALKASYRDDLQEHIDHIIWIYLQGNYELLLERIEQRENHFMAPEMLQSQCEILEEPNQEDAIFVDINQPVEAIIDEIINHLRDQQHSATRT